MADRDERENSVIGQPVLPTRFDLSATQGRTSSEARRLRRATLVGTAILLASAAALILVGLVIRPIPDYYDGSAVAITVGVFLLGMCAFLWFADLLSRPAPRARVPRAIVIGGETIRLEYETGGEEISRWGDPGLVTRVLDSIESPFYRPEGNRYHLAISRLPWKSGTTVLSLPVPEEAAALIVQVGRAQGWSVLSERFAVGGRARQVIVETQIHHGGPVDTAGWGRSRLVAQAPLTDRAAPRG